MGLISPGWENLLDFLELWQVLSTYDGDLGDPLWWLQERPFPCELLGGLSGFLYRRCRGLRPCVESVPGPEDSSPLLTWIFGYFWNLPREVNPRLELGHARALYSRAVAAMSRFPSRGSRLLWLSQEAFSQGCPTMPPWCESILGFKVEAVQGKQVSLEWTETSGGLWEWCHDPGVPLAFPVESVSSCDATGTPGILSRTRRERIPPLELGGGNGAPLDVGRTLLLPLEWRRVCRETS